MEATPFGIDVDSLKHDLENCCSVIKVSDLHVWSIAPNKNIMTVHLISKEHSCCYNEAQEVAKKYKI